MTSSAGGDAYFAPAPAGWAQTLERRPELGKALAHARRARCHLVVAKLDCLSLDPEFISRVMAMGVPVLVAELGRAADRSSLIAYAGALSHQRELASQRAREALAAAKARGTKLGNPRPDRLRDAQELGALMNHLGALEFATSVGPTVEAYRREGMSLRAIAEKLNEMNVPTAREGGRWHVTTVRNVLERFKLG